MELSKYALLGLMLALQSCLARQSFALDAPQPPPLVKQILDAAKPVPVDDSTADWRPLHYKIYATSGAPIGAEEMRQSIERLSAIYRQQVGTIMADKLMSTRRDKIIRLANSLLDVDRPNLSASNCSERMGELNALMERNSPFKVNLIPLLRQNRQRLFDLCEEEFYHQAEEAISELNGNEEDSLIGQDFLEIMVTKPNLSELVDETKLAGRVNQLLEARNQISKSEAAKRIGDKTYESYYDQMISTSCDPFESYLRDIIVDKYHLLEYGLDLFERNEVLNKWLRYSQACMSLIDNKKAIMRSSMVVFQDKFLRSGILRGRR